MTLAHREHQRGVAGAAAETTRDRHAITTTSAVGMRRRDRRSRARVFGAPRAASCREGALTIPKCALKILQKAQNATEMRASNFATIFAATGSLGPRRRMKYLPTSYYPSGRFQNFRPVPWRRTRTPRSVIPPKSSVFHLLLGVAVAPDTQIARLEPPGRTK